MSKDKEATDLAVQDEALLQQIRQQGGGGDSAAQATFPLLKLEHTTDFEGEPNPRKGQFVLSTRDTLGKWNTKELGTSVTVQILLQRYVISLRKKDAAYASGEFDHPDQAVKLWKSVGDGEARTSELFAEGNFQTLGQHFLVKDDKGKVRTELKVLKVLYMKLDGQIVKWKTNVSGTIGFNKYCKQVEPFAVMTKIGRKEEKKGTNKYYAPNFEAVEPLKDFRAVLDEQAQLRAMFSFGGQPATTSQNQEVLPPPPADEIKDIKF